MSPSPVILITAGSAGLGAATAKVFAAAGYRVAINYANNSSRAAALIGELSQISPLSKSKEDGRGEDFVSIKADLEKKGEIGHLVEEAIEAMGRIDVVFSNGGWTSMTRFGELDDNVDEEMWVSDACSGSAPEIQKERGY